MYQYISLKQAAEQLNLKPRTLRQYIKEGKLIAFKDGNRYYITPENFDRFSIARMTRALGMDPDRVKAIVDAAISSDKSKLINDLIKQKDDISNMLGGKENDKQKN